MKLCKNYNFQIIKIFYNKLMSFIFGTSCYKPNGNTLNYKSRLVELQELLDYERLTSHNLRLEAKLLKLKINKIQAEKEDKNKSLLLPKLSNPVSNNKKYPISLTPHPIRAKKNFFY